MVNNWKTFDAYNENGRKLKYSAKVRGWGGEAKLDWNLDWY